MDGKKIAFAFGSKQLKKPLLAPVANSFERKKVEAKKELIGSIEGVSFDVLNAPKLEEAKELIIPLPPQSSISDKIAQLVDTKRKLRKIGNLPVQPQPENESIEQRAAREIQEDLRRNDLVAAESADNGHVVKPLNPDELPLDGGVEPSQDDYDNMPVDNFGLAMLRGMGFKGELKKVGLDVEDAPMARPKGMGLGVDRARLAQQVNNATTKKDGDEKLELKKNAFAKIISGKMSGSYGVIQGMDDYSGQVYIKLTLGGAVESVQEFMLLPVSKDEYAKSSKVINSDKYEEYKSRETSKNDSHNNHQPESTSSSRRHKTDRSPDDRGYRSARSSKYHNKESDSEHSDDSDDYHKKSRKKSSKSSSKKSKKHSSRRERREDSYSYSSDDEEEKRFKKKTKKSKRPRSRSRSRSKPRR